MKRTKMLGVTLLEVMLVLAVAAMIIVMSIRYYKAASLSGQVNQAMAQIQAITAAADNMAIGPGSYTGMTSALLLAAMGGGGALTSPTGAPIVVAATVTATTYTVSMPLTPQVCTSLLTKLAASSKISTPLCSAAGVLTYTYNNAL